MMGDAVVHGAVAATAGQAGQVIGTALTAALVPVGLIGRLLAVDGRGLVMHLHAGPLSGAAGIGECGKYTLQGRCCNQQHHQQMQSYLPGTIHGPKEALAKLSLVGAQIFDLPPADENGSYCGDFPKVASLFFPNIWRNHKLRARGSIPLSLIGFL